MLPVGRDPHDPHGLAHVSRVGSVQRTDPAQPRTTAGDELDDLQIAIYLYMTDGTTPF